MNNAIHQDRRTARAPVHHRHHHDQGHSHAGHAGHERMGGHGHAGHDHAAMIADFRRRFWVSLVLTVPVLILSPMIQRFLGLGEAPAFPGFNYLLFVLSAVVFFYGGWPFLKGLLSELEDRRPGMMP